MSLNYVTESNDFMSDFPSIRTRRGGRPSADNLKLVPAAELRPFARALQRWIGAVEEFTDTRTAPYTYYALQMGIDPVNYGRVYNDRVQYPSEEFCRRVQQYFAMWVQRGMAPPSQPDTARLDLPGVAMELAGHGSDARYEELRQHAHHIRPDLMPLIAVTASPYWRDTRLPQRREVDTILLSSAPWDMKISHIARKVQDWLIDPQAEMPEAERRAVYRALGSARA